MTDKQLLKIMCEKEQAENNNYAFFGCTGLFPVCKNDSIDVLGRYSAELQCLWIYPDKKYQNVYTMKQAISIANS